jgi:hypothetical protein
MFAGSSQKFRNPITAIQGFEKLKKLPSIPK